MPKNTTNPAEVAALGQKVMTFDMPAEYEGINGVSADNMVFERYLAEFRRKDGKGSIALLKMRVKLEGGNNQDDPFKTGQFQKTDRVEDLLIQSTEDKKLTIRGKETDVSFSKAKRRGMDGILNVITVRFDDLKGFDTMVIVLDDDVYDEDEVVKMIESIK